MVCNIENIPLDNTLYRDIFMSTGEKWIKDNHAFEQLWTKNNG